MNTSMSFWVPIKYDNRPISLGRKIAQFADGYLAFGNKVAVVTSCKIEKDSLGLSLQDRKTSYWKTIFKVVSYASLIIPSLMFVIKLFARSVYSFHICNSEIKKSYKYEISEIQKKYPQLFSDSEVNIAKKLLSNINSIKTEHSFVTCLNVNKIENAKKKRISIVLSLRSQSNFINALKQILKPRLGFESIENLFVKYVFGFPLSKEELQTLRYESKFYKKVYINIPDQNASQRLNFLNVGAEINENQAISDPALRAF